MPATNPAAQYLALKAIGAGITQALKVIEAQVDEVRTVFGSKSFDDQLGTLGWTQKKDALEFPDESKLLEYLAVVEPAEVEPAHDELVPEVVIPAHTVHHPARVKPTGRAILTKRLKIVKGAVVDTVTGEELPWVRIVPGGGHWTARLTDDAKEDAARAIVARIDSVAALLDPERPRELDQ